MLIDRDVTMDGKSVGRVQVRQQGLYYLFRCRCNLQEEVPRYLLACCGEKQENLGILVPMEGGFGLDTRRPVKNLGQGRIDFVLRQKAEKPRAHFTPIYPEEPFSYLERLKDAYLEIRNGQMGALWWE